MTGLIVPMRLPDAAQRALVLTGGPRVASGCTAGEWPLVALRAVATS